MDIGTLFFGFLFGALLVFAGLNRFDVITGNAVWKDLTIAKALLMVIGVGALLLNTEIAFGLATYHVKPFILGGVVLGGLIFGVGMAILGYCPGTLAVSLGEGSLDALAGIFGALAGGLVFTVLKPSLNAVLGPDLGKISLFTLTGNRPLVFFVLLFLFSAAVIILAFALHRQEERKGRAGLNYRWLVSGIGLAILNSMVFLKSLSNRPIGASTSYPYLADKVSGITHNAYFAKISVPGRWELVFLAGAFLAGLLLALLRGKFQWKVIHTHWKETRGVSVISRLVWAFAGGFILLFGARMAGGCTSGHILSGGMQVAVSSLVFAVFVFAAFVVTGKLFYKKQENSKSR